MGVENALQRLGVKRIAHRLAVAAARACERRRCRARGCGCGSGSGGWGACGGSVAAAGRFIRCSGAARSCPSTGASRGGNEGCSRVSAQAWERPVHVDADVAVAVGRGRDQRGVRLARKFWRGEQGPRRRPQPGGQRDAAPVCAVGLARAAERANEMAPVARLHRSAQGIDVAGRGRSE